MSKPDRRKQAKERERRGWDAPEEGHSGREQDEEKRACKSTCTHAPTQLCVSPPTGSPSWLSGGWRKVVVVASAAVVVAFKMRASSAVGAARRGGEPRAAEGARHKQVATRRRRHARTSHACARSRGDCSQASKDSRATLASRCCCCCCLGWLLCLVLLPLWRAATLQLMARVLGWRVPNYTERRDQEFQLMESSAKNQRIWGR